MFRLRPAPCFQHLDLLSQYYTTLRWSSEEICSITLDDIGWSLPKLPTKFGGLRAISDLALPVHPSSTCSSLTLCPQKVPSKTSEGFIRVADSPIDSAWSHPTPDNANLQSSWDNILDHVQEGELKPLLNQCCQHANGRNLWPNVVCQRLSGAC